MKIYIDWDRREWCANEEQVFEELVDNGELKTYSDFLADEYLNHLDELLDLSEEEKKEVYERYVENLKVEFEDMVKFGSLSYTVLDIEKTDNITVKEIL